MAAEYSALACTAHKSLGIVQTMYPGRRAEKRSESNAPKEFTRKIRKRTGVAKI